MSFDAFLRLFVKASGEDRYRAAIRTAVRGLWNGTFDYDQFYQNMYAAINRHIPLAWYAGAKECGIAPSELTEDERQALAAAIAYELLWINGFASTIEERNKKRGGLLRPLFARAEIWIGRWEGVRSKARVMACQDKKLKWTLGDTEHCPSCLKLAGKIKRASFWNEQGILPRVHGAPWLECHGFRCRCSLVPTDEPLSRGPLPNLP